MDFRRVLRSNIAAELGRRDVTQSRAAEALGLSQTAFSSRMSGRAEFKISELVRLASYLGVPVSVLLAGLDEDAGSTAVSA
jgi:predicted transcriptional regulator